MNGNPKVARIKPHQASMFSTMMWVDDGGSSWVLMTPGTVQKMNSAIKKLVMETLKLQKSSCRSKWGSV